MKRLWLRASLVSAQGKRQRNGGDNLISDRRVVITGLGVISSIGIGKDAFWEALIAGKSRISEITSFDTSKYDHHYGGEVKNFSPEDFIDEKKVKSIGRASQFAIAATKLALQDAGLDLLDIDPTRIGISIGTTMGESQIIEEIDKIWVENGEDDIMPSLIPQYPGNVISPNVALEFGFKGPNLVIPTACAAGNYAIGYACDLLRFGRADIMIAGGSDSFSRIAFTGFNRLFAMAPEKCQPFDKNRKGMMLGEGAGMVTLELLEDALKRGALIYAEILGYGINCDAHHMTIPDVNGIVSMLRSALKNANITLGDVGYVNAHGTGTIPNDKAECRALKEVFSEHAESIPVSSIKSMLGHTMGAASALEAIASTLTVKNDTIPPTINYETEDPECAIDCVPNVSRRQRVDVALNNSYAFGGNNACLVLKKFDEE